MLAVITTENDGNAVGILAPVLLARPLEFILADHLRQRNLCALLERLAGERRFNPALGASVANYMADELPIHMLDEDEDLFPLLRRRALPGDDVERVLGLLSREHSDADRQLEGIVNGLREAISAGRTELDASLAMTLRTFAHRKRRHLAVENAIIMPLAEARLTPKDSEGLARRMAVRRRIRLSPGASA